MFKKIVQLVLICLLSMLFGTFVFAQSETNNPQSRVKQQEDLPKNIKENLAKQRIEQEKKEHQELLQRTEEAVKLSEELEKAFTKSNQLSAEDLKKLEKLEKLVKKIRGDLGGSDDDDDKTEADKEEKPGSMLDAFKVLQTSAVKLFDEVKKTTRYSISAVAIQSSNLLLKVLKFIRFGK